MQYKDVENFLGLKTALPITEDWSAAPDFLYLISEYCLKEKPEKIVECSSGTSSLVLARCCELNGGGKVYSLENGKQYVESTQNQLAAFSLSTYCDVIYSPLESIVVNQHSFQWYSLNKFKQNNIDMLVIDGPPGFIQKNSRYPALPLLEKFMAKECIVFLDDAARDDEKNIVQQWLKIYPEFEFEYINNERGCSILKRK